jgi:hypothetical protein
MDTFRSSGSKLISKTAVSPVSLPAALRIGVLRYNRQCPCILQVFE